MRLLRLHHLVPSLLIAGAGASGAATLDDLMAMRMEDLLQVRVSSASKRQEGRAESPAIISVLTRREIELTGAVNLLELLHWMPSVMPAGTYPILENTFAIRGDGYGSHLLILMNGKPMRDVINTGSYTQILATYPVTAIERIEVLRGSASTLHGSGAFSGLLNIVTDPDSLAEGWQMRAQAGAGTYGYRNGDLTLMGADEDAYFKATVRSTEEDGWPFRAETGGGPRDMPQQTARFDAQREVLGITGRAEWKGFFLDSYYSYIRTSSLGLLPHAQFAGRNGGTLRYGIAGYEGEISPAVSLSVWVYQLSYQYRFDSLVLSHSEGQMTNGAVELDMRLADPLRLVAGFEADDRRTFNVDENSYVPREFTAQGIRGHAQLEWQALDDLKVLGGVQTQSFTDDSTDRVTSPRLGLVWSQPEGLGAKILYGRAFNLPSLAAQYTNSPGLLGNPKLRSERNESLEAQISFGNSNLELALTGFAIESQDLIAPLNPDNPGPTPQRQFKNAGRQRYHGAEVEAKWNIPGGLFLLASASYQETDVRDVPRPAPPRQTLKAMLGWRWKDRLTLSLSDNYYGAPIEDPNAARLNPEAHPIHWVSAHASVNVLDNPDIRLGYQGTNLLDEQYDYPEYIQRWYNTIPLRGGATHYVLLEMRFGGSEASAD